MMDSQEQVRYRARERLGVRRSCFYCGGSLEGNNPKRKYCCTSHRVSACRNRKKAEATERFNGMEQRFNGAEKENKILKAALGKRFMQLNKEELAQYKELVLAGWNKKR